MSNEPRYPRSDLAQELDCVAEESECQWAESHAKPPTAAPESKSHDYAGVGFFELLGLMFGLPPAEALYHGEPIDFRMLGFILVGCAFAGLGTAWPTVRKKFPQQALVLSVGRIASDARYWFAIIIVGFLYAVAPDLYQRAMQPIAVTGAIGAMPIGTAPVDEAAAQAAKKANTERDQAIQSAARIAKERDDAIRQRDAALVEAGRVQDTGSYPKQNETGPIKWNDPAAVQLFGMDSSGYAVHGALFWGESTESVSITEAYAISGLTGHKQDLKANVTNKGYFPVDKVDIPPGAPVHLDLVWNPPIPIKDFLSQWGKFHLVIVYNGVKFERDYDEALVRKKLQENAPGMFGPQMTPRDDK